MHDMGGIATTGHPDNFANEEYFGVVELNRQPRAVYTALANAFAPPTPASFDARYNGSAAALTWLAVSQATSYDVSRSDDGQTYHVIGSPASPLFADSSIIAGHAYLYRVRAVNSFGSASAWSNPNLMTAVSFTNDPIVVHSTKVNAAHVTELRTAINAVRTLAAMQAGTFTNTIIAGANVRALDFSELRTALVPALSALTLPAITFAHTTLQANVSSISAIDVAELRDAIR
jgi:hypothetical protein